MVEHEYKVGDKVMINNNYAFKYHTLCVGTFPITQFWTNNMVTLHYIGIMYVRLSLINTIQTF